MLNILMRKRSSFLEEARNRKEQFNEEIEPQGSNCVMKGAWLTTTVCQDFLNL